MSKSIPALLGCSLLAGIFVASPACAQSRNEQAKARQEMQAGKAMSIRQIEQRILPMMKGAEYIGFDYDNVAQSYRLKFIRKGHVIWIDVDARTAKILRISR